MKTPAKYFGGFRALCLAFWVSSACSAQAAAQYLPDKADFFGKWKISGAAIQPPADLRKAPTTKQKNNAANVQQDLIAFYQAFDYLEIKSDGHYNFHQRGDPGSGPCVWCGTWTFKDNALWISQGNATRLDIYKNGGDIQMRFVKASAAAQELKWQVFGWKRTE